MLIVADPEAAPGFLHASLFLFFMGLGGSVLNVNTIVPLATSGFFYVFTFFAPVPISAITIPELILRSYLVSDAEVEWLSIQGMVRRSNKS
jgi:hypothetical protein